MLRRLAATTPVALAIACSTGTPPSSSGIGVQFHAPQALLDDVQSVNLHIVEAGLAGITCDESTGMIATANPGTGLIPNDVIDQNAVVTVPLGRSLANGSPCPNDGVFCSEEIVLPTAPDKPLVFQAVGLAGGAPLAVGCATAAVNSDPFYVSLSMLRYVAPAVCGDGILQIGEQCEPPSEDDPVCDSACQTREVLLSSDHIGPANIDITNEPAGSKSGVALAWSQAPDAPNPNPLHAVFEDTNFGSTGTGPEVNYRQMGQDFLPIAQPPLLHSQVRLPRDTGDYPGFDQRPRTQATPAVAAMTDGSFVVAYEDDRSSTSGQNISFTAISVDVATPRSDEIYINNLGVDACSDPTIAGGPNDLALVAWADNAGRRVRGRLWSKTGWLSSSDSTFSATDGDSPRAAGWNDGWIVVWHGRSNEDNDDIVLVQVDAGGTVGAPVVVNDLRAGVQDRPTVASLPNGSFAVTWHDTGRVMLQRFDASGQPIAGDQSAPVNDGVSASAGDRPAIAASSLALGFYAIAWQTTSGEIRARLIDRTAGYLFNSVDGQATSFLASRPDVAGSRSRPSVAIGGGGHIVFAWQDDAADHSGIYARRFPLPAR